MFPMLNEPDGHQYDSDKECGNARMAASTKQMNVASMKRVPTRTPMTENKSKNTESNASNKAYAYSLESHESRTLFL